MRRVVHKIERSWITILLLLAVVLGVPSCFTNGTRTFLPPKDWTLVHINANFLRISSESSNYDRVNYGPWRTKELADAHVDRLGKYLGSLNADFIHICEVHDRATLERLVMHLSPTYRIYMIENYNLGVKEHSQSDSEFEVLHDPVTPRALLPPAHATRHNMHCAFITNFDPASPLISFTKSYNYKGDRIRICRNLGGLFSIPGCEHPVFFFGLHLPVPPWLRVRHTNFLMKKLGAFPKLCPEFCIHEYAIFLGDFNCGDPELEHGSDIHDNGGDEEYVFEATYKFKRVFSGTSSHKLINIMHSLPHGWSTHRVGKLDHGLMSEGLVKAMSSVEVPQIHSKLPPRNMISDHSPIVIKLRKDLLSGFLRKQELRKPNLEIFPPPFRGTRIISPFFRKWLKLFRG